MLITTSLLSDRQYKCTGKIVPYFFYVHTQLSFCTLKLLSEDKLAWIATAVE